MKRKDRLLALLFLLPSLVGFITFYIIPVLFTVGYSMYSRPVNGVFVGLDNFRKLFASEPFRLALTNTLKFMAFSIPLNIIIPLIIGVLLHKVVQSRWLGTLFMSPLVVPSACIAFLFQSFFGSNGLLSNMLQTDINWLQTKGAFWIASVIYIWKNMGYNLVLILAGLAEIPAEYAEWAAIEGMGKARCFFQIEILYLIPSLFIVCVMSFINSFKIFRELYMLAGNYPHESIYMLQHYMNNQFSNLNYPNLTAASLIITVVIAVIVLFFFIVDKKSEWEGSL